MIRSRHLFLAALLPVVCASAGAATLRHHYPLDGAAADALGGADLKPAGAAVVFHPTGGATNGYVSLADDGHLRASLDDGSKLSVLGDYRTFRPFAISCWVRQTSAQAAAETQAIFGLTTNSADPATINTGFEVVTRESTGGRGLRARARNGGTGSNEGEVNAGADICDGSWHHVAVSYEKDGRTLYLDGAPCGRNGVPVPIPITPIRHFAIGAFLRGDGLRDAFTGDVDDFRIFDGALSPAEVEKIYRAAGGTPRGTPIANAEEGSAKVSEPIGLIDPLLGAEDTGYCVPGACLPQSSIYPSPNTLAVAPSGYKAGSPVVGFAQLHAQGAGPSTPSYGHFLISPRIGPGITEADHGSTVSDVVARPYGYRAMLDRWKIACAAIPAANSAIYRFEFPAAGDARIVFDVARKMGRPAGMTRGSVMIDPATGTISGGGTFDGNWNPAPYQVFFYAKTDVVPRSCGTWKGDAADEGSRSANTETRQRLGGWLDFGDKGSRTVHLKIAVSFVSVERARAHLEREIPKWDLAGLEQAAKDRWIEAITPVRAPGIGREEGRKLYTALFHSLVQPRDRTLDAGWAADAPFWDDQYTLWDTWQSLYPLLAIVKPDAVAANVNSFGARFARNGRAETAFIQGKDFQVGQGGDDVEPVIADAVAKRIPGIDWEKVWPLLKYNTSRRTGDYLKLGYVSDRGNIGGYDSRMKSGSSTLAFAYGDWCVARVAESLGHHAEAAALLKRSRNWRNVWDPGAEGDGFTGFVRARNRDGTFRSTPAIGGDGTDFYQGTCWNYSFNVPHERDAMIELMGGRARFVERLDFALGKNDGRYINFANEPSFQAIWQFCHAGRPYLASYWADRLRQRFGENSYPGDEDSGAMSSLYFFLTAGMFPCAGQDHYYLHGPRVPRLEFRVAGGKTFTITAENAGGSNIHIRSATLDGKPLDAPLIRHADILAGRTLSFVMGPYPTGWGTGGDFRFTPARTATRPVRGWQASAGSPEIADGATDSPRLDSAGDSAIQAAFPEVTLANPGETLVLTSGLRIAGMPGNANATRALGWGLFHSAGWTGYLATNDADPTAGHGGTLVKAAGSWHTASGGSQIAASRTAAPPLADGDYRIGLKLSRNATGGLDYTAALVRVADGVLVAAFTGADPKPAGFTFDRVGLRAGKGIASGRIEFHGVSVSAGGKRAAGGGG